MTGSAPVCDCPESRVCYAEGYDQSEAPVSSPGEAETIPPRKTPDTGLYARRPAQEDFLHAYIDKSGNTGFNLFDRRIGRRWAYPDTPFTCLWDLARRVWS